MTSINEYYWNLKTVKAGARYVRYGERHKEKYSNRLKYQTARHTNCKGSYTASC